jgi:DNA-binding transcriptional LysR family regulator
MAMSRDPFVLAFVPGVTPSKWVGVWRERMPAVPLELRPMSQAEAEAAVLDGSAHVALVRLPFSADGVDRIQLYAERAVVVLPKGHALEDADDVSLSQLDSENLLSGDNSGTVELVAANVGVAVMPQSMARLLSRKDVVSRFVTDAAETQIALAWRKERTGPMIEEFIGIVRGRTANSSRGAGASTELGARQPAPPARSAKKPTTRRSPQPRTPARKPRKSR